MVEVAEELLRGVQDLDEGVLAELVPLDRDVEQLETLVAAGVRWGPRMAAGSYLPKPIKVSSHPALQPRDWNS